MKRFPLGVLPFVVAFAVLLFLAVWTGTRLWWIPAWYLDKRDPNKDVSAAINEYREASGPIFLGLMQGLGGAAILFGLWLNWREHNLTRLQHRAQRLREATEQLESAHASTRMAAVHEFEVLARESAADVPRLIETLRAYIRNRAAPPDPANPAAPRELPDDILPAIGVLTRLSREQPEAEKLTAAIRLDLRGADLRRVPLGDWLYGALLEGADLSEQHFSLDGVKLRAAGGAVLHRTVFSSITWHPKVDFQVGPDPLEDFGRADLSGARFVSCAIWNVNFRDANLDGALFDRCHFTDCDFTNASLRRVIFRRGGFEVRVLQNADMEGAIFDGTYIRYPNAFDSCAVRPAEIREKH